MNRIVCGDALEVLHTLESESIDCCITSPPYWALRDYGVKGQLGLEKTPEEYISNLVVIFREVRRVLRAKGTLWLNLGDSYSAGTRDYNSFRRDKKHVCVPHVIPTATAPKNLMMMPARVALALQADGWFLRSQIPWLKRTAMPESVKDRPTNAVEYIYLLSKSERYYYDHEAIKLQASFDTHARYARGRSDNHKWSDVDPKYFKGPKLQGGVNPKARIPSGWNTGPGNHRELAGRYTKDSGREDQGLRTSARMGHGPGWRVKQNESFSAAVKDIVGTRARRNSDWFFESWQGLLLKDDGDPLAFVVNPKGFKESHYATFPEKLVEPMIQAGCPIGGSVLDPFGGAGTVGVTAKKLQRDSILIDLKPDYCQMAERRIENECGGLF